jgi:hypothetical protein
LRNQPRGFGRGVILVLLKDIHMSIAFKMLPVFLLLLTSFKSSYAQGNNNHYALDEMDIQHSLKLLGIEVYKFPMYAKGDDLYLNYVIEEYHDTVLANKSDMLAEMKKSVGEKYIPRIMASLKVAHDSDFIRTIVYDKPNAPFEIQFSYKSFSANDASHFDKEKYGIIQARGFVYSIPAVNQRIPVLAVYANNKGENVIHCPGNAKPEEIRRLYAYSCFVYIDVVKL